MLEDDTDLDNRETLYKCRNNVTKCINQSLTVVGEKLKFNHPLTMHVARHTFAVLALNDGMQMSVVSRLLGHASTGVTEKSMRSIFPRLWKRRLIGLISVSWRAEKGLARDQHLIRIDSHVGSQ